MRQYCFCDAQPSTSVIPLQFCIHSKPLEISQFLNLSSFLFFFIVPSSLFRTGLITLNLLYSPEYLWTYGSPTFTSQWNFLMWEHWGSFTRKATTSTLLLYLAMPQPFIFLRFSYGNSLPSFMIIHFKTLSGFQKTWIIMNLIFSTYIYDKIYKSGKLEIWNSNKSQYITLWCKKNSKRLWITYCWNFHTFGPWLAEGNGNCE